MTNPGVPAHQHLYETLRALVPHSLAELAAAGQAPLLIHTWAPMDFRMKGDNTYGPVHELTWIQAFDLDARWHRIA